MLRIVCIIEVLRHGENNAISAEELSRMLSVEERELRHIVQICHEDKQPILSSNKGYFLPSNDQEQARKECRRFIAACNRRARSAQIAAEPAKHYIRVVDRQVEMNFDGTNIILDDTDCKE